MITLRYTPQSFKGSLSLFIGRSEALLSAVVGGDFPEESVPVVVTADAMSIRDERVLDLEGGKVGRSQRKGLLLTPMLSPLMRELTHVGEGAAPMGRGSETLLVLAEADTPFLTVAQLLYTAEIAGYQKLLLGGVSESNAKAAAAPMPLW